MSKKTYGIFFKSPNPKKKTLLNRTKAVGVSYKDRMNFPSEQAAEKFINSKLSEFKDEIEVSEYDHI